MQTGTQLQQYWGVLVLLMLGVVAVGGMIVLSFLLGKRARRTRMKDTAYECGMMPAEWSPGRVSLRFYLVAVLFLLFDIEVVFLYPWAVVYREMLAEPATRALVFGGMLPFLALLGVGLLYEIKKRGFDWQT
ncbi:MAG: NADH-quinone oxidoreductase subunit A [Verrucomicrobiota bacterium]|nr:NADH-quinone oxidoreductase subunit A [Limisphaera sp.]MDW8381740.1 NADH-quinone oxidoreductase subunit A [Verrucomicrobiota bacterium]